MNINATIFIPLLLTCAVIVSALCYFFAKEKRINPVHCAITGFILSFLPPLSLVYMAFVTLVTKDDGQ